jgi:hypothetical protein
MLLMASSISCVLLNPTVAAIHAGILESEPHGFHAVVVAVHELASAAELHADHAQPVFLQLVDVIDHFAHVVGMIGVLGGWPVHARAAVVDADQAYVEPVLPGI